MQEIEKASKKKKSDIKLVKARRKKKEGKEDKKIMKKVQGSSRR